MAGREGNGTCVGRWMHGSKQAQNPQTRPGVQEAMQPRHRIRNFSSCTNCLNLLGRSVLRAGGGPSSRAEVPRRELCEGGAYACKKWKEMNRSGARRSVSLGMEASKSLGRPRAASSIRRQLGPERTCRACRPRIHTNPLDELAGARGQPSTAHVLPAGGRVKVLKTPQARRRGLMKYDAMQRKAKQSKACKHRPAHVLVTGYAPSHFGPAGLMRAAAMPSRTVSMRRPTDAFSTEDVLSAAFSS
mmetsp:Transcript_1579/g.4352  ORF Transcript_1579/g.4352 Transcript_1579/m.4352 type:complete len:245 (+) Transcript_1579:116-850(+)